MISLRRSIVLVFFSSLSFKCLYSYPFRFLKSSPVSSTIEDQLIQQPSPRLSAQPDSGQEAVIAATKDDTNPNFPSLAPSTSMWNTANTLTIARVISIPFFMAAIANGQRMQSVLLYVGSCITDFLDGYIARKYKQTSSFGSFLDPVADKLLVASALILLMMHINSLPFAISVTAIICREIFVSALREWMAERGNRDTVQVGSLGKIKTALQMTSTILLMTFLPNSNEMPEFAFAKLLPVDKLYSIGLGSFYFSAALTVYTGWEYFRAALPSFKGETSRKSA